MKILVFGSNGQVGSEFMARQASSSHEIIGIPRAAVDITDLAAVKRMIAYHQPMLVVNAAAFTAVDKAEVEPEKAMQINRDGPMNLATACATTGAALIHFSTDYVFDGEKGSPYLETDAPNPQNIYGRSKWLGEEAIRQQLARHLILRVSWVFGAHGNNFVKTMLRLAKERPELRVVADQHGFPTHAGAIAQAVLRMADRLASTQQLPWGTHHFTGTPATTWHSFAEVIIKKGLETGLLTHSIPVHPITTAQYPTPAKRPMDSRLACAGDSFPELMATPWMDGLRETLAAWHGSSPVE